MEPEKTMEPENTDVKLNTLTQSQHSASQPAFPLARYKYDSLNFYYAYGNTQAEDFLQSCSGVKNPSVLSLGNGDIRSCFYTLWKNFDVSISSAPQQFDGAEFLLNDKSSAVLARNIVFIYLCLQLPKNTEERKKWLSAMWAVWYCHELYPQHQMVLDDSLESLLKYSDSLDVWACIDNPLHSLVHFTSPVVLAEISQVWKWWLEKPGGLISVERMHSTRLKYLRHFKRWIGDLEDLEGFASSLLRDNISIVGDTPESKINARIPEVASYINCGNCFAESVFGTDLPLTSTTANLTLYENQDRKYTLHYCPPINSYYHTVEFSPKAIKRAGVEPSACDSMLVPSESFKSHPLLANSVQQFSMWVQSSSAVLNEGGNVISFAFNNQDALTFCQELQANGNQFDVVFSSNLMDHLGLPNVVLSAVPLVTSEGLLFTGTMMYKYTDMTCFENFLSMCFGFDADFLPVILGVRCINHEGADFASPVMIQPSPGRSHPQRLLIWQKVTGQPMAISKLPLPESGNVTEGLVCSLGSSALTQMNNFDFTNEDEKAMIRSNCIETAMLVLQTFMSLVDASSDYHFCETLCHSSKFLKSFHCGLQTQALLHGLHMHFTVDETSCPMCRHCPIDEYIGLFCAEVSLPFLPYGQLHFMALIHPYSSLSEGPDGQNLSLFDRDIHVIDCFDGTVCGKKVLLKFFAPKLFVIKNFNVSMVHTRGIKAEVTVLYTTNIRSMQVEYVHYNFARTTALHRCSSVVGDLVSCVYTRNNVTSDVALSDSLLEGLALSHLKTKKISSDEIQLACGPLKLNLKFLFPVDYKGTNIKLSRARRTVEVISPRQVHQFEEEKPIFIASPDHQLSLPPQDVKKEILRYHSRIQMISGLKLGELCSGVHAFQMEMNGGPLLQVKAILANFFESKDVFYFHLLPSDERGVRGHVFVNKRMFDYRNYAPAVDLAFCFSETDSYPESTQCVKAENISVDDAAYDELKKVLLYFAERTNGDCKSAGVNSIYHELVQGGVDKYFTRAVVYFLYCDPEMLTGGMFAVGTSIEPQSKREILCSFCGK